MNRKDEELLRLLLKRANGSRVVQISQGELASLLGLDRRRVGERLRRLCEAYGIRCRRTQTGNLYILPEDLLERNGRPSMPDGPESVASRKETGFPVHEASTSPASRHGTGFPGHKTSDPRDRVGDPLYSYEDPLPIGRSREAQLLEDYLRKGLSVVVRGAEGVGKSVLVRHVARWAERGLGYVPLYIARGSPTKEWLVSLATELARRGHLEPQNFERLRNPVLSERCLNALRYAGEKWLLVFDHCEKLNSTQALLLEEYLKRWPCVLVTSREKPLGLALPEVELEPLSEEHQAAIVELFVEDEGLYVEDLKVFTRACVRRAQGNLKKLMGLLQQAAVEKRVTCEWVHKELGFEKERDYIDATPAILIGAAVVIGIRFFGLGFDDRELYVLAGLGYAMAWALRVLMWRWRKPKTQQT